MEDDSSRSQLRSTAFICTWWTCINVSARFGMFRKLIWLKSLTGLDTGRDIIFVELLLNISGSWGWCHHGFWGLLVSLWAYASALLGLNTNFLSYDYLSVCHKCFSQKWLHLLLRSFLGKLWAMNSDTCSEKCLSTLRVRGPLHGAGTFHTLKCRVPSSRLLLTWKWKVQYLLIRLCFYSIKN